MITSVFLAFSRRPTLAHRLHSVQELLYLFLFYQVHPGLVAGTGQQVHPGRVAGTGQLLVSIAFTENQISIHISRTILVMTDCSVYQVHPGQAAGAGQQVHPGQAAGAGQLLVSIAFSLSLSRSSSDEPSIVASSHPGSPYIWPVHWYFVLLHLF